MPKIFVVRVLTQWYNLGTGVDCMDFKDVEKRMYRDEEFLKYLLKQHPISRYYCLY